MMHKNQSVLTCYYYYYVPGLCSLFSSMCASVFPSANWEEMRFKLMKFPPPLPTRKNPYKYESLPFPSLSEKETSVSPQAEEKLEGENSFGSSNQKLHMWPHSLCQQIRKRRPQASFQELMIQMKIRGQRLKPWVRCPNPRTQSCILPF